MDSTDAPETPRTPNPSTNPNPNPNDNANTSARRVPADSDIIGSIIFNLPVRVSDVRRIARMRIQQEQERALALTQENAGVPDTEEEYEEKLAAMEEFRKSRK